MTRPSSFASNHLFGWHKDTAQKNRPRKVRLYRAWGGARRCLRQEVTGSEPVAPSFWHGFLSVFNCLFVALGVYYARSEKKKHQACFGDWKSVRDRGTRGTLRSEILSGPPLSGVISRVSVRTSYGKPLRKLEQNFESSRSPALSSHGIKLYGVEKPSRRVVSRRVISASSSQRRVSHLRWISHSYLIEFLPENYQNRCESYWKWVVEFSEIDNDFLYSCPFLLVSFSLPI